MAAVNLSPAPASALLLLAALAACAGAYDVTTPLCKADGRDIPIRSFPIDYQATRIYTHACNITTVNFGDFEGLPNLTAIQLDINDIAHIDTAIFRDVPALEELQLGSNKLRELPVFEQQSCTNLKALYLHNNLLTTITNSKTFEACQKLQNLTLSANRIQYLHPEVFSSLTELKELFLGGNELTFIQTGVHNKLKTLSLGGNRLAYLPSDFLANLGANLENFYFNGNPWQCASLIELLAEVKRVGIANYKKSPYSDIVHFDGTHTQCKFIGRYPCRRIAIP